MFSYCSNFVYSVIVYSLDPCMLYVIILNTIRAIKLSLMTVSYCCYMSNFIFSWVKKVSQSVGCLSEYNTISAFPISNEYYSLQVLSPTSQDQQVTSQYTIPLLTIKMTCFVLSLTTLHLSLIYCLFSIFNFILFCQIMCWDLSLVRTSFINTYEISPKSIHSMLFE